MPRSRVGASHDRWMFKVLRNFQSVFQKVCTMLLAIWDTVAQNPFQHLILSIFLLPIVICVEWNLIIAVFAFM